MGHRRSQRHIADRKNIRMPAAEHQVDLRRPRADATKRYQLGERRTRLLAHHAVKVDLPFRNGARQPFQRRRLGPGKAEAGAQRLRCTEIIFRRDQAAGAGKDTRPYGIGAGARHHLRHDDMGKAGKAGLVNAQLQRTGFFYDGAENRIEVSEMLQPFADVIHPGDDFHIGHSICRQPAGGAL